MHNSQKPLWHDILHFSRHKIKYGVLFILIGIPGLVFPVIPGIALIVLGIYLFRPLRKNK